MKTNILFLLFLCMQSFIILPQTKTEEIHFDIYLYGKKIGSLKATHNILQDGTEKYRLESRSAAKVLWIDRDVYSVLETEYKSGRLIRSSYKETDRGELKKSTKTELKGEIYETEYDKSKAVFRTIPELGVIHLYFGKEVPKANVFYNECDAEFQKLEKKGNSVEFKTRTGETSRYIYENGRLKEINYVTTFATVKFVRV